jgi:hypothetical protein
MRIPASTIVMSLVACLPFGLAIRDALSDHHGDRVERLRRGDLELARDEASSDAIRHRDAVARDTERSVEEERHARDHVVDTLIGERPATMGSLLDGLALGAPADSFQPESTRIAIERALQRAGVNVTFDLDALQLNGVTVSLAAEPCPIGRALTARWGPRADFVWLDAEHHQRAWYDDSSCAIAFDRYDDAPTWVAKLPLTAIGAPARYFASNPSAEVDGNEITWTSPGLGIGHGPTKFLVVVANGKVEKIQVFAHASAATIDDVRKLLTAKLGVQPKAGARDTDARWPSHPPVSAYELAVGEIGLTIGNGP